LGGAENIWGAVGNLGAMVPPDDLKIRTEA